MNRMHRLASLPAPLLLALGLLVALAPAGRAEVEIDYDLSRSRITTFAGLVELTPAPAGTSGAGAAFARITLSGEVDDVQDGPAWVEDFALAELPIDENLLDLVSIQGSAAAVQLGTAAGTLSGEGHVLVSPAQPFALATHGDVVCTPADTCSAIGAFPIDLTGTQILSPVAFELANLDVPGRSSVRGQIEIELNGHTATVELVGIETARRSVPEPAAALQLAAGLLGLCGLRRTRARRRAAHRRPTCARRAPGPIVVLALVSPLLLTACEIEVHTIPIHVIALSDDDGGRANQVGQAQIASHVAFANTIYEPAGIQFSFDPATDWETRNDTALNSMQNSGPDWWLLPNAVAARYPGKIVVFLRFGPDTSASPMPAGNGFAYPPDTGQTVPPSVGLPTENVDFVALPNQMLSLWPNNQGFLAHEIGHYLGLFHTQPTWGGDADDIQAILDAEGLPGLDGDGLSDTPEDAADAHFLRHTLWTNECQGQDGYIAPSAASATGSVVITPDRGNVMGYFWCQPLHFSGQQILILRDTLRHDLRRHLIEPVCSPDHHRLPAADFQRCFDYWRIRGWWPVSVSATQNPGGAIAGGGPVYMTSSIQPVPPRWVRHLATSSAYQSAFDDALVDGFRPEQVQGVKVDGQTRYNAVWTPIDGAFESYHSMSTAFFASKWGEMGERGWQLVDFDVHDHGSGFRFAATWVDRPHSGYIAHYDMSAAVYDQLFDDYGTLGWEVVRFSTYRDGGQKRYAALWHPSQGGGYVHHPWQTPAEHQANYDALYVQGYRLRQLHDYDGLISAIWHRPATPIVIDPGIVGSVGIGTSSRVTSGRAPAAGASVSIGETGGGSAGTSTTGTWSAIPTTGSGLQVLPR